MSPYAGINSLKRQLLQQYCCCAQLTRPSCSQGVARASSDTTYYLFKSEKGCEGPYSWCCHAARPEALQPRHCRLGQQALPYYLQERYVVNLADGVQEQMSAVAWAVRYCMLKLAKLLPTLPLQRAPVLELRAQICHTWLLLATAAGNLAHLISS